MNFKFNASILLCFFSFFSQAQDCAKPTATINVEWNNLQLTLAQGGSFLNPEIGFLSNPGAVSGFSYSNGICVSGINGGNYKSAVSRFTLPYEDTDFWTGPLHSTDDPSLRGEAYGAEYCQNFDRFWTVNMEEVQAHKADWEDNNSIDNMVSPNILGWPGQGNPEFENINNWTLPDEILAPFTDRNSNGIYEPLSGDYPEIKGTWNVWKIINDAGNIHTESNGDKMSIELSVMYYAFASENSIVANTFYTDIILTNDSSNGIDSTIFSLFTDHDIIEQEAFGCNPAEKYAFFYADKYPESHPVELADSTLILQKILTTEENEAETFSNFTYVVNSAVNNPPAYLSDPATVLEYVFTMNGKWRDSSPLTFSGNGYGGENSTDFAFPDNPNDPVGWSMCNEDLPGYDYRTFTSAFIGNVLPGSVRKFTYSTTFLPDYGIGCPDFTDLDVVSEEVEAEWEESQIVSVQDFTYDVHLKTAPNPAVNYTEFNFSLEVDANLEIYNVAGELKYSARLSKSDTAHLISLSNFSSGIYFYSVHTENKKVEKGKIVVLK